MTEFEELLSDLVDAAKEDIDSCTTLTELENTKARWIGAKSDLKKLEQSLWKKTHA